MNRSLTATLKYAQTSDRKMEIVARLVRGKDVNSAINILTFTPKKAAKILLKVVKSAYANAIHNAKVENTELFIDKVQLGKGPNIKRMRFVGRSRIHSYLKYRTFVRVVLNIK